MEAMAIKAAKIIGVGAILGVGVSAFGNYRRNSRNKINFGIATPYLDEDLSYRIILEDLYVFNQFAPKLYRAIVQDSEKLCRVFALASTSSSTTQISQYPSAAHRYRNRLKHVMDLFEKRVKSKSRAYPQLGVLFPSRYTTLESNVEDYVHNTLMAVQEAMMTYRVGQV